MGNGLISCCEASTSKVSELRLSSFKVCSSLDHSDVVVDADKENRTNARTLALIVVNSGNISKGTRLVMTREGLIGSFRNQRDGITYFGAKKKIKDTIINDYVIPVGDKQLGQHFSVTYKEGSFWIKDLGKGFGVFLKLDYALSISDNMMISIGESFVVFSMLPDN